MRIIGGVFESMLVALLFAPLFWLATLAMGVGALLIGMKKGMLIGIGLLAGLAAATWFGGIWLSSQCTQCNYVDGIYQRQIRWGLLFWEISLLATLFAMSGLRAWRVRREVKEV